MYILKHFKEENTHKLVEFIQQNSFGILFSHYGEEPEATHLPFIVEQQGDNITLIGHFAKANSHWKSVHKKQVLVVFPGPHAYISASWYQEQNTVPTWNYVTVQAQGNLEIIKDTETLINILENTTKFYEKDMKQPWNMDGQEEFIHNLLKGIVGFKIHVHKLEGKWKLSQNHTVEKRERVIHQLESQDKYDSHEIAMLMKETLK
jgi:transcriptional regulator